MKIAIVFLVLLTTSAMSQTWNNCHPMSKDPKCWKDGSDKPVAQKVLCRSYENCTKIKTVTSVNYTSGVKPKYHCMDFKNNNFDCSELVNLYGTNLYGLDVKLKVNSFDTCHKTGECGQRACIEEKYASTSPQCQGH
jgi:hypothetical protein